MTVAHYGFGDWGLWLVTLVAVVFWNVVFWLVRYWRGRS